MPKITEMWAWVLADGSPDNEGVPTMKASVNGVSTAVPAMGADFTRAAALRSFAQHVANKSNQSLKLIKCSQVEIVEWVYPKAAKMRKDVD